MTFFIESLIACALFTLFVFLMSRNPIKTIFNYPPSAITGYSIKEITFSFRKYIQLRNTN